MKGEKRLQLYLFYEEGDGCVGIWQGTVDNVNPAINYQLYYTKEDTGVPENFRRINGVILENDSGHKYAVVWDDMPVNVNNMRIWSSQEETASHDADNEQEEPRDEAARAGDTQAEGQPEEPQADKSQEEKPEGPQAEVAQEEKAEEPKPEEPQPEEPQKEKPEELHAEELWREGTQAAEAQVGMPEAEPAPEEMREEEAYAEESTAEEAQTDIPRDGQERPAVQITCTKIQRNELARLPRCEWRLSNNNFLLHGYYNYHHLALIDDGERLRLGVPGIYHPQEAKAAAAFGFPEFIRREDLDIELSEDERNGQEQFGYWCRYVRRQAPSGSRR